MHSSWGTKQSGAAVVGSFTLISLFVYGDDQFVNLSVPFQNAMPLDTRPVTRGRKVGEFPLEKFSPPWKNVLGII